MRTVILLTLIYFINITAMAQESGSAKEQIPEEFKEVFAEMAESTSKGILGYTIQKDEVFSFNPLSKVVEKTLVADDQTYKNLLSFRNSDKFLSLPGEIPGEKDRLNESFNSMLDQIINGIQGNPSKIWVFKQMQPFLKIVAVDDTEAEDHFLNHVETVMEILSIESSDGLLNYYAYFYVGE